LVQNLNQGVASPNREGDSGSTLERRRHLTCLLRKGGVVKTQHSCCDPRC
jgi:hypothetical protein